MFFCCLLAEPVDVAVRDPHASVPALPARKNTATARMLCPIPALAGGGMYRIETEGDMLVSAAHC